MPGGTFVSLWDSPPCVLSPYLHVSLPPYLSSLGWETSLPPWVGGWMDGWVGRMGDDTEGRARGQGSEA